MGFIYHNERVPQDYKEAFKWWRLAAEQGIAAAQYTLGVMYKAGEGVPQDNQRAIKWLRLAAQQGDVRAQDLLNSLCRTTGTC